MSRTTQLHCCSQSNTIKLSIMAPTDPSYKEIAAQENFLGNGGGRSTSRRPKSSTILLSLSTFFFAFLSLYFALESDAKCVSTSFKNGYTIEWGTRIFSRSADPLTIN